MNTWKKLGIAASVIAVVLLTLGLASGKVPRWIALLRRGNTWNSRAIEATFAGVQVREVDSSNATVVFLYDLDNKTDDDYQLAAGSSLIIMSRVKSDGSLTADEPLTLAASSFVPARNRTRIAVQIMRPFSWPQDSDPSSDEKFRNLLQGEIENLDGFVLFDQPTRYQIDLPGDWKDLRQTPAIAAQN